MAGHSYGGFITFDMIRKHPERILSASVITPAPPHGFGTRNAVGTLIAEDGAGTGNAQLAPALVESICTSNPEIAAAVLGGCMYPPFKPARAQEFVCAFLSTHSGAQAFPGDSVTSAHWPFTGPGKFGSINSMSGLYTRNARLVRDAGSAKPFVWWLWCKEDGIVSETKSFLDAATHGAMGTIAGYPGAQAHPPTPCITQTRAFLEEYKADGGKYVESVFEQTGHMPFLEKAEEFNKLFHQVLAGTVKDSL